MSELAGIKAELTQNLKHLHLPTIRECYEETAQQAERETLSYERYLHEVVQRECDERLSHAGRDKWPRESRCLPLGCETGEGIRHCLHARPGIGPHIPDSWHRRPRQARSSEVRALPANRDGYHRLAEAYLPGHGAPGVNGTSKAGASAETGYRLGAGCGERLAG